ncbi:MAG: hypothetical protein LBD84_05005 [Campylobacteraceae bacterium]|jgi:hypothetical protein|nr:hypothetical protein [Campylobacteraceae bacterium]
MLQINPLSFVVYMEQRFLLSTIQIFFMTIFVYLQSKDFIQKVQFGFCFNRSTVSDIFGYFVHVSGIFIFWLFFGLLYDNRSICAGRNLLFSYEQSQKSVKKLGTNGTVVEFS